MKKRSRFRRLLRYYLFRTRRLSRHQLGTLQDWKMRAVFWVGAVLVGLLVVALAWVAELASQTFMGLEQRNPLIPLVLTPAGMLFIVWVMRRIGTESQGSGIPQVLLVLKQRYHWLRPAFLSLRVIAAKFLLTVVGLFCGASIGREGPSVQMGAAMMYSVGQVARLRQKNIDNALIVAGGAAGVSAAFNAPLAGIMFAIEELAGSFEQRTSGTLILSIFLSGVVVLMIMGHYSFFGHPEGSLDIPSQWYAIVIVGLICGLLGGLFSRLLIVGSRFLSPYAKANPYRVVFLCALVLVFLGLLTGGATYGSGYEQASDLLSGKHSGDWLFPLAKMAATLVSYFTGIPGGLFSPCLAAGAGVGNVIGHFFPNASLVGITLVAMAAFLSAVIQRPITSFVIVMELTGNRHDVVLPLMAGAFLAAAVAKLVWPRPLYDSLAERLSDGQGMALETPQPKDGEPATESR
ncbi:voltage-gated chloride channel family protein [Alcanivorax hongdengensis A-11-3]|uniref:Voltage-gated chloride channel family protein n=1 Tax=Alcanivorax hongdengensis A-11-3 TaxID=1177179 RepID=L0WHL0_9GAMM|nr:chloride channel protein [Alcanivorax hongdengensis]EKF75325.1 voltage-gated chloride channel family protein [Alcanivorax hongdengensis A-11-3]